MHKFLITGVLACLAQPAFAAQWEFIATSTSQTDFYLDVTSIREVGKWRAAWEKRDYSRNKTKSEREDKILEYYDCSSRQMAVKDFVTFDASGGVTASGSVPTYSLSWDAVVPDSVIEPLFNKVCGL